MGSGSSRYTVRSDSNVSRYWPSRWRTGCPASLPEMSHNAISRAALILGLPPTRASMSATILASSKGSRPRMTAVRSLPITTADAWVSPVTGGKGEASPQPTTPSAVRARTSTSSAPGCPTAVRIICFTGMVKGRMSIATIRRFRPPPATAWAPNSPGADVLQQPIPVAAIAKFFKSALRVGMGATLQSWCGKQARMRSSVRPRPAGVKNRGLAVSSAINSAELSPMRSMSWLRLSGGRMAYALDSTDLHLCREGIMPTRRATIILSYRCAGFLAASRRHDELKGLKR